MNLMALSLALVAALSEILPLLDFTKVNGVLHGIKVAVIHFHADSSCNVDIDLETHPPTSI